MSKQKVIKAIKKYSKFLITAHIGLEGDALGSELALASLLQKLGKRASIVNADRTPANYSFLPGTRKICHRLIGNDSQAVFIIDCSQKSRIGTVADQIKCELPIINIDHHIDNKRFGRVNWVDQRASSAGEMIYHLFELTKARIDRNDAVNIFTAISTDTGSFRHSNTTSTTFHICGELLKFGINPAQIYTKIYEGNSAQDIRYLAKIISRINFAAKAKVAWIKINQREFKRIKGKHEIMEKVLDFAKSITTVKVVIIFCQLKHRLIKLSFRSKGAINVQKIALIFGGGGHICASGCTIKGSISEVERKVLKQVKKAL